MQESVNKFTNTNRFDVVH